MQAPRDQVDHVALALDVALDSPHADAEDNALELLENLGQTTRFATPVSSSMVLKLGPAGASDVSGNNTLVTDASEYAKFQNGADDMATLTTREIAFLQKQGIAVTDMFDATGLNRKERIAAMEAEGKRFYFGGAPCEEAGHMLRVKAGHCIQCGTQHIAYGTRYSKTSRLYVAGSLKGRVVKVGETLDPADRLKKLISDGYGGLDDWKLLAVSGTVASAGKLEASIQKQLEHFGCTGTYFKGERAQVSLELFACNFATAAQAVADLLPPGVDFEMLCEAKEAAKYDWYN